MKTSKRDWSSLNEKYVREGFILFDPSGITAWNVQTKNGRGRPFEYSNGLMQFASQIRSVFRLGYRQLQGALEALEQLLPIRKVADYTTLWRRIVKIDEEVQFDDSDADTIILDSTGMSKQARSFHLGQRWRKRRDFIKLHLAVDENGRVRVSKVTPEKGGGDAKIGEKMLSKINARRALMDGSYDTKKIFKTCEEKGMVAGIPTRKNARPKPLADPLRARTIKEQKEDMQKWKDKVGYKDRWIVERTIGAFKRRFGDATRAKKYHQQSINMMMRTFMMLQSV